MTRDQAIEMAKKLKSLADRAKGGEKEAATNKLKRFCQKHGLNEDEYSTELISVTMTYKNAEERSLLSNVMCMVMESNNIRGKDKDNTLTFQCSPHQFELIKDAYSHYKKLYREYCEAVLIAMVTKNEIINTKKETNKPFSMEPMNEEEQKEWEELMKKMQAEAPKEQEPPKEQNPEEPAAQSGPSAPPPPPPAPDETARKNDRIARLLYVMEPNKWVPPRPKAKLFLH